jgi:catechol-2,3-dioxygenase
MSHATFETTDLDRQVAYYSNVIGLSTLIRTAKHAILGTPAGQEMIIFESGPSCRCTRLAFQLSPGFELGRLNAELENMGLRPEQRSSITPAIPHAVVFKDPKGTELELFMEHNPISGPAPQRGIAPLKLGHIAYSVSSAQTITDFYVNALGFRVSDWIENLFAFLRCGPDHHTVNFVTGQATFMHHMALELRDWGHFQIACDILGKNKRPIIWGPGRHTVGHNLFVFHRDPDDHIIEFYAELDLMKDEDLGFFEPRPWHEFNPQRPRVWKLSESAPVWGMPPSADFRRSGNAHLNN